MLKRLHLKKHFGGITLAPLVCALVSFNLAAFSAEDESAFFEKQVRPVLIKHCYECHSEEAGKKKGGLWLDRKSGWETGGDAGPTIVPGEPEKSLLMHSISYLDENLQMPPKAKLPESDRAALRQWVERGAFDPREGAVSGDVHNGVIDYASARREWAFRERQPVQAPATKDTNWGVGAVDAFIRKRLEERGLKPAGDAEPAVLLRRVFYDLTGLPPSPEEVAAYVARPDRENFARIVDDLLSRPGFGEKWGRHWLDVVRYADSNGGDRNFTFHQAWRFRNYVIESFNRDRSYYEMVRQQIAGDLLPWENDEERARQLIASGFLSIGPKMLTERDKEKLALDTADEQVDTIGRAFLGLTLGCARCHDHKFDPVSQEDYYAVTGIFRSTQIILGTQNGCVNVASWVEQALPSGGEELAQLTERLELTMRLTVDTQFKNKAGGKMASDLSRFGGVIYDDGDAEKTGDWKMSSLFSPRFGEGYIHDDNRDKGSKKVTFRGSLPVTGKYEVRLAYSPSETRAKEIPITVYSSQGPEQCHLDQTRTPSVANLFEPLGRFHFEKGRECTVTIETGGTGGFVVVDALQFIPVSEIEEETRQLAGAGEITELPNGDLFRMNEGELKKELERLLKSFRTRELAMAPREAADAGDIALRVRGDVNQRGPIVPRNFLRVLHQGPPPEIAPGKSGRIPFAEWLTGPENALLDRVMANRIWHYLFGRGIVATVDNFGRQGAEPTHPELLDYLANRFRENGGSIKTLVRELLLSRTYQLASRGNEALEAADPENLTFGRRQPRRLQAEEIRDSLLALSGELSRDSGAATALEYGIDLDKPFSFRGKKLRSVYLPVARNNLVQEMELFDAANPDLVTGERNVTVVPTQSLYLLNGADWLHEAKRLAAAAGEKPGEEVASLYATILLRQPNQAERSRAESFLYELGTGVSRPDALAHLAHILLISNEFLFLE